MGQTFRIIRDDSDLNPQGSARTLRQFWEQDYLTTFATQSQGSLIQDRISLNHWERCLGTPERPGGPLLCELSKNHQAPFALRSYMLSRGASGSTILKTWRELRAILNYARDLDLIDEVPTPPRRQGFVPRSLQPDRELVRPEDVERMFHQCESVGYPDRSARSQLMWRVLLAIDWMYGPRTIDLLKLEWSGYLRREKLLRFTAQKVNKLQGLPLPEWLIEILERWSARNRHERLFEGLTINQRGFFSRTKQRWVNGWRTAWRRDINAGIDPQIDFQDIRQAMLTRFRASGVGPWIAGHAEKGVSDRHYTQPTELVRNVIEQWEPSAVFREFANGRFWP